ncbi:MAG: glycosyltransferase family 2 protein [bacterium]
MRFKPLVLLPTFNSGVRLSQSLRDAHARWPDVWVVVDASTDGSDREAESLGLDGVRFFRLARNSGKGAAVLVALKAAQVEGFTHMLVMDADGQHPASMIRPFLEISTQYPAAFVCGVPKFGPDAPRERVLGRFAGNFLATLQTLGVGAEDSLFGFRLYPVTPALKVLESTTWGRRFDFDTVLAVRLTWAGLSCINVSVPVIYPPRSEGGVSHFCYLRDNLLLAAAHVRLLLECPFRALAAMRSQQSSGNK